MTNPATVSGRIFTFYSYKGGVGRSMALANMACLLPEYLSNSSQRILLMDWDLEAPGLHRFFPAQSERPENQNRLGIIDYFYTLQKRFEGDKSLYEAVTATDGWKVLDELLPLSEYLVSDVVPRVDLIKAGKLDAEYADMVGAFNWISFYKQYGLALDAFKILLTSKYAYCLIDSRTGFTDISGICTMLLPEKLVTVFTPNRQSLSGVLDLSTRATNYRRSSSDFRPLAIFPLPSRIENAELNLKREWRDQYQKEFEERFCKIYELEKCPLANYFDEVQLPYIGYYAYGEKLAVLEERSEALSLRRSYETFFDRLMNLDFAWDMALKLEGKEIMKPEENEAIRSVLTSIDVKNISTTSLHIPDFSRRYRSVAKEPEQLHFERVAQAIAEGRVIPFLGAGVNSSTRSGDEKWVLNRELPDFEELSAYLAESFKYPDDDNIGVPSRDLARVAQYVSVTHGLGPLYEKLHELFDQDCQPTPLHHFFATLPSFLRARSYASPYQLIVTSNYDDLLERAFKEVREQFDLLSYVAEGEHRGKFLHTPPDGDSIVIERPNEYDGVSLEKRSIILKANGFVDRRSFEQDSFVITEDNFIDYLTHVNIRNIVPTALTAKLRRSNYLFLGHSPGYWNLRVFLHLIWGEQKLTYNSWAIQASPDEMDSRTWETRGVALFNMRLGDYVGKLSEMLRNTGGLA